MFDGWTVLHSLSWVALAAGFVFVLLSLASGLLYVAEVIEEHSGFAKSVGKRLIYAEVVLFLLLFWVDGLPWHLVAVGIVAHIVYLQNFSRNWPTISLTSFTFIASCILVLASHFLSFRYFSARSASTASHHGRYTHYNAYDGRRGGHGGGGNSGESFLDVATYFAVCVWLVPFYLFLSLSANDNVLPSAGESPNPGRRSSTAPGTNPPSPTISVSKPSASPGSPSLGRHQRQRSSMMKTALSSAFGLIPSALRPSTLSAQLPLSDKPGAPRRDVPRSPSPTFGFQPYSREAQGSSSAFSSSASAAATAAQSAPARPAPLLRTSSALNVSGGPGASGGWASGGGSHPSSPTVEGLGFVTSPTSPHYSPVPGSSSGGGALASPSLASRGRVFPAGPGAAASQPPSPANGRFPPNGAPAVGQAQRAFAAPGLARRNTSDRLGGGSPGGGAGPPASPSSGYFAQPSALQAQAQGQGQGQGALGRRASEAVIRPGSTPAAPPPSVGQGAGRAGMPQVQRRGTTDGYGAGGPLR